MHTQCPCDRLPPSFQQFAPGRLRAHVAIPVPARPSTTVHPASESSPRHERHTAEGVVRVARHVALKAANEESKECACVRAGMIVAYPQPPVAPASLTADSLVSYWLALAQATLDPIG